MEGIQGEMRTKELEGTKSALKFFSTHLKIRSRFRSLHKIRSWFKSLHSENYNEPVCSSCCLLATVCSLLTVGTWQLPVCCLLSDNCCLLSAVRCLLPAVWALVTGVTDLSAVTAWLLTSASIFLLRTTASRRVHTTKLKQSKGKVDAKR
jgi:hypothetical protein